MIYIVLYHNLSSANDQKVFFQLPTMNTIAYPLFIHETHPRPGAIQADRNTTVSLLFYVLRMHSP